jgi:hypothetical protein
VLVLAAFVIYLFPEQGIAVVLLLGAVASFRPTSEPIVNFIVEVLEAVAVQAAKSEEFCSSARGHLHSVLGDPCFQRSFVDSCKASLVKSVVDKSSQDAMLGFVTEACATATVSASQDEELQDILNSAMRSGMKEALSDDALIGLLFTVMKEGLSDPKMHAAALKGAVTAANPLKDLTVPPILKPPAGFKSVSTSLKEALVNVEAKALSGASELMRTPLSAMSSPSKSSSKRRSEGPAAAMIGKSEFEDSE